MRGSENIDGDLTLRNESLPFNGRGIGITGCKACNEVVFPGLDGAFGSVASVDVRGDTLEVDVIFPEWIFNSSDHLLSMMWRSGAYMLSLSRSKQYF